MSITDASTCSRADPALAAAGREPTELPSGPCCPARHGPPRESAVDGYPPRNETGNARGDAKSTGKRNRNSPGARSADSIPAAGLPLTCPSKSVAPAAPNWSFPAATPVGGLSVPSAANLSRFPRWPNSRRRLTSRWLPRLRPVLWLGPRRDAQNRPRPPPKKLGLMLPRNSSQFQRLHQRRHRQLSNRRGCAPSRPRRQRAMSSSQNHRRCRGRPRGRYRLRLRQATPLLAIATR